MNHTARDFALQLGALGALYLSLAFLVVLLFGVINLQFPDAIDSYWRIQSAESSIRLGIAMTVVFFPTYLVLTRFVNCYRREESAWTYLSLTKWLIYLSLLVGGGILLGDLVAIIMAFLEGEITIRFVLKALVVLVVAGTAFSYYLLDAKGRWVANEKGSVMFGVVATAVVLAAVVFGFVSISSPGESRERSLDQQQINDLQNLQWRIISEFETTGEFPQNLSELSMAGSINSPEDRPAYRYELTENGFRLCAEFAYPPKEGQNNYSIARPYAVSGGSSISGTTDWDYEAGDWCFERVVVEQDRF